MNFKQLIEHYESLDKKDLIKKIVDKNSLILKQEDEIDRLNKEVKRTKELEQDHKQMNGNLHKEIKKLKEEQNSPLKAMREVGL
jgi:hypothetical protein|tara:strand:+ start:305 stop:556 length:252 start_codon:yes stop_codon:yes gene_type:complete